MLLSTTFMFADTLHIFVPYKIYTGSSNNIGYKEVIYENLHYRDLNKNRYDYQIDSNILYVYINDKMYTYAACQWWAEPDE